MTDELDALESAVRGHVVRRGSEAPRFDRALWDLLDAEGFISLAVPEELNGSGGDVQQAAAAVRATSLTPGPYAEALMVAGPALRRAGMPWPGGVVTATTAATPVASTVTADGGRVRLSGRWHEVAWLDDADHVVVQALTPGGCWVFVVGADAFTEREVVQNLAGETRVSATLADTVPGSAGFVPGSAWSDWAAGLAAIARSVQICEVAGRAVQLSIEHVTTRHQFGRPLGAFQVVQHSVAEMLTEVSAARAATGMAARSLDRGGDDALMVTAAAKIATARAVGSVTRGSHQLHGAMGTTAEHQLGELTTRLWSWREEGGNERSWAQQLAVMLASPSADPWILVTG